MQKNIQLALLILVIILAGAVILKSITGPKKENKIVIEEIKEERKDFFEKREKININRAEAFELKKIGLNKKNAQEFITYRNVFGVIKEFSELDRIDGIGKKTIDKIEKNAVIEEADLKTEFKKVSINTADEKILAWIGFTKKEAAKINEFRMKNGKIFSNVEMLTILADSKRYDYLSQRVYY